MLKLQVLSLLKAFNVKISDNLLLNFFTFLHMFYTKKVNPFTMETGDFFKDKEAFLLFDLMYNIVTVVISDFQFFLKSY